MYLLYHILEKSKGFYCSGIKYITQGILKYTSDIDNLNYWTAKPVKMDIDSILLSKPFEYNEDVQFLNYNLNYDGDNYRFVYVD